MKENTVVLKEMLQNILDAFRDEINIALANNGDKSEDCQRMAILNELSSLEMCVNGIEDADLIDNIPLCQHCEANLTNSEAICREYPSKQEDGDSVYASGHYTEDGTFEADSFDEFSETDYDLMNTTDTCRKCNGLI